MSFIIPQRSIWLCKLDTNGRKNSCPKRCKDNSMKKEYIETSPEHFFVIISKKNEDDFVTALPISSKSYQIQKNSGISINQDDIDIFSKGEFEIKKLTLVLTNKICRIPTDSLKSGKQRGILKKDRYRELLWDLKACIEPN